jgi:putative FmdB family regulatory protein
MPIYEYRCASCGYQNDFLQKLSEPPLTDCPECGKNTLAKQVTAAGFQLKGTGWYATDFKNNGAGKGNSKKDEGKSKSEGETVKPDSASKSDAGGAGSGGGSSEASACGAGACSACT